MAGLRTDPLHLSGTLLDLSGIFLSILCKPLDIVGTFSHNSNVFHNVRRICTGLFHPGCQFLRCSGVIFCIRTVLLHQMIQILCVALEYLLCLLQVSHHLPELLSHNVDLCCHVSDLILLFPQFASLFGRAEIQFRCLFDHSGQLADRSGHTGTDDHANHSRQDKCNDHGDNDQFCQPICLCINFRYRGGKDKLHTIIQIVKCKFLVYIFIGIIHRLSLITVISDKICTLRKRGIQIGKLCALIRIFVVHDCCRCIRQKCISTLVYFCLVNQIGNL